jgi:hypothetical protein
MSKALSTMILIIGGFIFGALFITNVLPAVARTGNAIIADRNCFNTRTEESIQIGNAYAELDSNGIWRDTDSDAQLDVYVWAKNTGSVTVKKVNEMDMFVHQGGTSVRIPNSADAGGGFPQWTSVFQTGDAWTPGTTLSMTVHYSATIPSDDYVLELVTAQGGQAFGTFPF